MALRADRLQVDGVLFLRACIAAGSIVLRNAEVNGPLDLSGAQLARTDETGNSLFAPGLRVKGSLRLEQRVTTVGALVLTRAHLGELQASDAALGRNKQGAALMANGLCVDGLVRLSGDFTARGALSFHSARVSEFDCSGAYVGCDAAGLSLDAERLQVQGALFLRYGFTAAGSLRLLGAKLGELDLSQAELMGCDSNGVTVLGDHLRVEGSLNMTRDFRALGAVTLTDARVGKHVICDGAIFNELNPRVGAFVASGMIVEGILIWRPAEVDGMTDLTHARVGVLSIDCSEGTRWTRRGELRLLGLKYDAIAPHDSTLSQRLAWVRCQLPNFAPQPYEQLASVYRSAGQEREATRVLMCGADDYRRYGSLSLTERASNRLLGTVVGHGYRPARALLALSTLYLVTALVLAVAQQENALVPARPGAATSLDANSCTREYPCFSPWAHAIDAVVPLVRLGQSEAWRVDAAAPWGWAYRGATWTASALGWFLSTLGALAVANLVRRR